MKSNEKLEICPNNNSVYCYPSERKCESCGWNPEVSKRRLDKFEEEREAEAKALAEKNR